MFAGKGKVCAKPSVRWHEDGRGAKITLALENFTVTFDGGGHISIEADIPRAVIFWLWGNLDRKLIQELREAELNSTPSPRLEEVRQALDDEG